MCFIVLLLRRFGLLCWRPRQPDAVPAGQGRRSRVLPLHFQGNSAAGIANTCLQKGVPRAQTNSRALTWPGLIRPVPFASLYPISPPTLVHLCYSTCPFSPFPGKPKVRIQLASRSRGQDARDVSPISCEIQKRFRNESPNEKHIRDGNRPVRCITPIAIGVNLRGARREPAGSEIRPSLSDPWWKPLIFQPDHVEDMVTEVVFVWTNARLSTDKVVIVFDVLNVASRSSYY
jgi:hypothetical protein